MFATLLARLAYCGLQATCGLIESTQDSWWDTMADEPERKGAWTEAERAALRKLLRMALILLLAIIVAGTIAALLSSSLGTL